MTSFFDGPAKDRLLTLQRSPVFLRVTVEGDKLDALDQLEDEPTEREQLHVYRRIGEAGRAMVDGCDPKTHKRFGYMCTIAAYRYFKTQPSDEIMRDTDSWRAWCAERQQEDKAKNVTRCRSCQAEIVWLPTTKDKKAPVNAETVEVGDTLFDPKKHMNHFATCPHAKQWKKKI